MAGMQSIPLTVEQRGHCRTVSTGTRWEPVMGYSRAVRSGNFIAVTGTVGINADGTYPPDIEAQTRRALEIIAASLESLGARLEHVIRTRILTTDISRWEAIASVHGTAFREIRPATTLVEVSRLIEPAALIEIEADAIVP